MLADDVIGGVNQACRDQQLSGVRRMSVAFKIDVAAEEPRGANTLATITELLALSSAPDSGTTSPRSIG